MTRSAAKTPDPLPEPSPVVETTPTTSDSGPATPTEVKVYLALHDSAGNTWNYEVTECSTCEALVGVSKLREHEAWHKRRG
jgi:hypothetical protein